MERLVYGVEGPVYSEGDWFAVRKDWFMVWSDWFTMWSDRKPL